MACTFVCTYRAYLTVSVQSVAFALCSKKLRDRVPDPRLVIPTALFVTGAAAGENRVGDH